MSKRVYFLFISHSLPTKRCVVIHFFFHFTHLFCFYKVIRYAFVVSEIDKCIKHLNINQVDRKNWWYLIGKKKMNDLIGLRFCFIFNLVYRDMSWFDVWIQLRVILPVHYSLFDCYMRLLLIFLFYFFIKRVIYNCKVIYTFAKMFINSLKFLVKSSKYSKWERHTRGFKNFKEILAEAWLLKTEVVIIFKCINLIHWFKFYTGLKYYLFNLVITN